MSSRLIYDVSFREIIIADHDSFYVYSFAFGNCLFPLIALMLASPFITITEKKINIVLATIFFANIIIFSFSYFGQTDNTISETLTNNRGAISTDGSNDNVINPITISFYGALLCIASLHKMLLFESRKDILSKFNIVFLSLGLTNLLLGASRGPTLTFLVVFLLLLIQHFRVRKYTFRSNLKLLAWIFSLVIISAVVIYPRVKNMSFFAIERMVTLSEDRTNSIKEARDFEWQAGLNQFYENPILGDKYINDHDNTYPHNIFIESLMATGIIGSFFFFSYIYAVLNKIYYVLTRNLINSSFFIYLGVAFLSLNMTSGSLLQNGDTWSILTFIVSFKYKQERLNQ